MSSKLIQCKWSNGSSCNKKNKISDMTSSVSDWSDECDVSLLIKVVKTLLVL